MNFGKFKISLGILCFAVLCYWILGLNVSLPGSPSLHVAYESTHSGGRRGPWPIWLLSLGGIVFIWSGLRDLGISSDDPS